ncbi:helix-turn-helix domain-containing protein [Methylorubrum sp. POS3]|uniref:helix-turn-helix domain-containing protein n=1 Tax=Methylorubrum sp. POS3 TaxID=2998492 RepID=UPI0037272199
MSHREGSLRPPFRKTEGDALVVRSAVDASAKRSSKEGGRHPALSDEQIGRLRAVISERIDRPLTLRDLAGAAGLSESYFVRAFKRSFGVTPYRYVLCERVALAQSLIRSGGASLSEVARRSGFPDARRMGRTFRQLVGHSPTRMKREG